MPKLHEVSKTHKYICLLVSTENYITHFYNAATEAVELIPFEKRSYKENFLQSNSSSALFSKIFIDASSLVRKWRKKKYKSRHRYLQCSLILIFHLPIHLLRMN